MKLFKWIKKNILLAIVLLGPIVVLPTPVAAQEVVRQGPGAPGTVEWVVNSASRRGGETTEVCVTNGAGGTVVPATALAFRKMVELQNLGPNAIFCTVDGSAPLSTGANGRRIAAAGVSGDAWRIDAGPAIIVTCIAATAAQVTPACTQVTELR